MSNLSDDERLERGLDRAAERFERLVQQLDQRQTRLENRLTTVYQMAFGAFVVVVVTLSFLTILLSRQVPGMTLAIDRMNQRFASVVEDMVLMERSVRDMEGNMQSLPGMVANIDGMHGSLAYMSLNVTDLAGSMGGLDEGVGVMTLSLADMRQSFQFMELNVGRMGEDVNHMSQPMRMFNFMNPLR